MAEDLNRIQRFVDALIRRERGLLLARTLARAALVMIAFALWLAASVVLDLDRGPAAFAAVLIVGIGGWFAAGLPLLVEWRRTSDPVRQAARVEALRPELRGRLLTTVARQASGPAGESDALLGLLIRRTLAGITGLPAAAVHPAKSTVRLLGFTGLATMFALLVLAVVGPASLVGFWVVGGVAQAEVAGLSALELEDLTRVGDLVIRYRYPDYTGLEPKVVANSTGDVAAPPGTSIEVTARSAELTRAAGLVAYDERFEGTVGEDGRTVTGGFRVNNQEGVWHIVLYRDAEPERSRDFKIVPQADLPPDVNLDVGDESGSIEVALDGAFPLQWQARDDFGVRKVGIALDGRDLERVLERPETRRAELQGQTSVTPRELGMVAGQRGRFSVVAWDNDTVSGSKRGESRSVEVVVLGAQGLERRTTERREALLEKMIPILARFLTEPWPPGDTSGEVAAWGEEVASRYQPLSETVEQLWRGFQADGQDRAVVEAVIESGRSLVRYTQVSFEPGSVEAPRQDALVMTSGLRESAIRSVEDGILALHAMLRSEALAQLVNQSRELEAMADQIEAALAAPTPDAMELLAKLDQLERMMEQLARDAARLDDGQLKELLNQRENEARSLMDEIRKAIAEGRLDDAKEMMERLSTLTREMGQGIQDEVNRQQQQGNDSQQNGDELREELEALEKEQRALQSEVQALREEDSESGKEMKDLWEEIGRKVDVHQRSASDFATALGAANRAFYERERAAGGVESADELRGAVSVRDLGGARTYVGDGKVAWTGVRRAYEAELLRRGDVPGPGRREIGLLQQQLSEIDRLLDALEQAESQVDPQTLQQSQALENRQRDLENRLQQAQAQAESFEQQSQVRPQGMKEALEDAGQRMEQAGEDLGQGQPMQAEGSQGVAAQRIRDALDALKEAQQQSQQQQQQLSQGGKDPGEDPHDGEPQDEENGKSQSERPDLEIPGREEFRTPEEYRRALLEGMEGEVPEEYRAMKRRYFEELVHQ